MKAPINDNSDTLILPRQRRAYVAYGLAKATKLLVKVEIHRANRPTLIFPDVNLFNVVTPDEHCLTLQYDKCAVELVGENLMPLVDQLTVHYVTFAERYDPCFHLPPAEHMPFIEQIRWKAIFKDGDDYNDSSPFQDDVYLVVMK